MLSGVLPRLYPQTLDVAYRHQDAGVPVFICTAATQGTADMLAHVLDFDGAAGSRLEARDGVTGRLRRPVLLPAGQARPDARARRGPRTWISRRPGPTRTPSPTCRCSRAVGHPVAVNPDRELALEARAQRLGDQPRFETLGRRLKVAAAVTAAAAAAGGAARIHLSTAR